MIDRRALLAAVPALLAAQGLAGPASAREASRDFDFLAGEWRVRHRWLKKAGDDFVWAETDGTFSCRLFDGGWGNVEEHLINAPAAPYRALGLRAWDPAEGLWRVWWLDGREPHAPWGLPASGGFENGVGTFLGDIVVDGKSVRQRLTWSKITAASAEWAQAWSHDGGATWQTNWTMSFRRAEPGADFAPARAPQTAGPLAGARGFDFLVGDWDVSHRRLVAGKKDWIDFTGTCRLRLVLDGAGNMEEHSIEAPAGAYRATGLRTWDPASESWAIHWIDERYPAFPQDPAATGRFKDGVGNFISAYDVDGKPMIGRLQWSRITPTSAHWEQASSADGGATWQPNWTMEFRRR